MVGRTDHRVTHAITREYKLALRRQGEVLDTKRACDVRVGSITRANIELARRARLASDPEALEVRIALVGDVKVRPLNEVTVPDARKPRFYGRGKKRVRVLRTFKY